MNFFFCRSSSKQQNKTLEKHKNKISELQDQPPPGLGRQKNQNQNQQEKTLKLQKKFQLCPQCLDLDIPASKTKFDYSSAWESCINRNPASKESKKTLESQYFWKRSWQHHLRKLGAARKPEKQEETRSVQGVKEHWEVLLLQRIMPYWKPRGHCPNINTIGNVVLVTHPRPFANFGNK